MAADSAEEIGGFGGAGNGCGDFCAGDGMALRVGDTQLQGDALASQPGFWVQQFDGQRFRLTAFFAAACEETDLVGAGGAGGVGGGRQSTPVRISSST